MDLLGEYNIHIEHQKGTVNQADPLSRRPDYAPEGEDNNKVIVLPTHLFLRAAETVGLEEWVKQEQVHLDKQWKAKFGLQQKEGHWYFRDWLVVVENHPLRRGVLKEYHDHQTAGHPGNFQTTIAVARDY